MYTQPTHLVKTMHHEDDWISYDLQRAQNAVRYLVETAYFPHRVRALRGNVSKPRRLPFKDDAEVLNELLIIGRQNLQAMENLIALAERKRDTRNDYQRDFMRQKRHRERLAVRVEEIRLRRKLTSNERYQYLQSMYEQWNKARDAAVSKWERKFVDSTNRQPTNLEKFEYIKSYWDKVDSLMESMAFNKA
jgi:hypothetical protein